MKTLLIVLFVVDLLMIGSTLLCGFWIRSHANPAPDPSSLAFHQTIALATSALVVLTLVLGIFRR